MTCFRAVKNKENPYVMVNKYIIHDTSISWKAKGILVYLLSRPDNWKVYENEVIKHSTDGRDGVRAGIRELVSAGYIVRVQGRSENGKFEGYDYEVYETPLNFTVDGKDVNGSALSEDGFPDNGKTNNGETVIGLSDIGKPDTTNNNQTNNNLTDKEESEKRVDTQFQDILNIYNQDINKLTADEEIQRLHNIFIQVSSNNLIKAIEQAKDIKKSMGYVQMLAFKFEEEGGK